MHKVKKQNSLQCGAQTHDPQIQINMLTIHYISDIPKFQNLLPITVQNIGFSTRNMKEHILAHLNKV